MARRLVGLELGPGELRAAEVTTGRRVRRVATLSTNAIDDRGELVDPDLLAKDIRRLWKLGHFRTRSVIVGLTSPQIATRPVEFPRVPAEHARSTALYEVEELLSFSIDNAVAGVEIAPDTPDATSLRALVIAAPTALITSVMAALASARVQLVDLRLSADSTAHIMSKHTGAVVVVVDVGATRSSVAICEGGSTRMIRQLAAGADPASSVTEDLEFELLRIQEFRRDGPAAQREQLSDDDRRIRPLVEAVRGSIEFHLGQDTSVEIEQIVVTGTHRDTPGLVDRLGQVLGTSVVVAPELTEGGRADAAAALVLDVRTADLSLLPTERNLERRFRRALAGSVALALLLGLGLFGLTSRSAAANDDLEARADVLDRQHAGTTAALAKLTPLVQARQQADLRRHDATAALKGDVDWLHVLRHDHERHAGRLLAHGVSRETSNPGARRGPSADHAAGDVTFTGVGVDQTTVGRWLIAAGGVANLREPRLTQSSLSAVGPFGTSRVLFTIDSDLGKAAESTRAAAAGATP